MCGICGLVSLRNKSFIESMTETLVHRGPDSRDFYSERVESKLIEMGHTRLAIIDLSEKGSQPMRQDSYVIVFNGELYNFREIRSELEALGFNFNSDSDTEVVLKAYIEWGNQCVRRFIGMFSFAIYDSSTHVLEVFRDRVGVKPLYYAVGNDFFAFASELRALREVPYFEQVINLEVISEFINKGYISAPRTIYKDCFKVEPGTSVKLNLKDMSTQVFRYWNIEDHLRDASLENHDKVKTELLSLLQSSVAYRMIADVPVGVFLSGGYDSSLVAALAARIDKSVKTFTISFEDPYNEAPFARSVAEFLGTNHFEFHCTSEEAKNLIKDLPEVFDEPFGDSSAIPTIMLSRLTKPHVKVALSADGGDENFAGYDLYNYFHKAIRVTNRIPILLSLIFGLGLSIFTFFIPLRCYKLKHKFYVLSRLLKFQKKYRPSFLYEMYTNNTYLSQLLIKNVKNSKPISKKVFDHYMKSAFYNDFRSYLPDDILVKVDRSTMSVGLEGRDPLLDHRLVEYAARISPALKINRYEKKIIFKEIAHDLLPKGLLDRPKKGFSVPLENWLRNDLGYLITSYLNSEKIEASGVFSQKGIKVILDEFYSYRLKDIEVLWRIIQYQMWFERWHAKN